MEFLGLIKKNWYRVIHTVFAFFIYFFTTTQDVSKLVKIISFCYILLLGIMYSFNFYKNRASFEYNKKDSFAEVIWKWCFKVTTLLLILFALILMRDTFGLERIVINIGFIVVILAGVFEFETLVFLIMIYFKRKLGYLHVFLGIIFIALLNNIHFINLLFGAVGVLFVAQFILSDNFFDYLKKHYSKYDMITIKRYMKANKTRFLAFAYLITFSGNVIFVIKHLLPSEIKDGLKSMILNAYNWVTRTNIPNEFADLFLINTIILGIIILFYTLIDNFFKGKFKKIKASILKYMREDLQEKKVGNSHE